MNKIGSHIKYLDDLQRIQYCLHELGYDPTLDDCNRIWRTYSKDIIEDGHQYIFKTPPDSDFDLMDVLKEFLEIK